jgi:hypothetical protein
LSSSRSGSTSKSTIDGGSSCSAAVVLLPGSLPVSLESTPVESTPVSCVDVVGVWSPVLVGSTPAEDDVLHPSSQIMPPGGSQSGIHAAMQARMMAAASARRDGMALLRSTLKI